MTTPLSGALSFMNYGWETAFGTSSTQINKTFGYGDRITSLTRRNNVERVFGLGARNAQALPVKQYEGNISVEFILSNPWFLRGVMGTCTDAGSGPFTHTFTESNTLPSITVINEVDTDTKHVATLLGAKVANMSITAAINELARVRLDMPYKTETEGTTTVADVAETFDLFTFANASFELPNATTITDVQNCEVTINNSLELVYGLGSRFAQNGPVKTREYGSRVSRTFEESAALLEKLYGGGTAPVAAPGETATLELVFDNALTTTSQRQVSFIFTGVMPDEHNMPQDPTALIIEDVPLIMRSLSATAIDNTSVCP